MSSGGHEVRFQPAPSAERFKMLTIRSVPPSEKTNDCELKKKLLLWSKDFKQLKKLVKAFEFFVPECGKRFMLEHFDAPFAIDT
uniref:Uncharacterized protein n=1 Tax=Romanomermis culicivorax TaxID=13658 RepID=A0A915IKE0_ROMCU